ncbi:MAG: carboxylating nicotinate-nucleotide diphosphorylase [Dehalococcoidia bacterium]
MDLHLLDPLQTRRLVEAALQEDGAWADVTTTALVSPQQEGAGTVIAKADGVIAGLPVMMAAMEAVDPAIRVRPVAWDGRRVRPMEELASLSGPYASILRAERVALNFLQRLSGVATMTAQAVEIVAGLPVRVIDTRKTTPGLRMLEKYAIRVGGGHNHRFNLTDGILIKDNHLAALRARGMGVADAVAMARAHSPHTLRVEIEVTSLDQVNEALIAGADVILLDNMAPATMAEAVVKCRGRALTEASGGITLANLREVAETGVDLISLGALTHSVKALDISLELTPE